MSIENTVKTNKFLREIISPLTINKICKIIGHKLSPEQKKHGRKRILYVCAAELTCHPGSAFFMREGNESIELAQSAAKRGAKVIFSPVPFDEKELGIPVIVVPNSEKAFIQVCTYYREKISGNIVALTGSVGKTTTKDMLRCVSQTQFKTLYSKGNRNGLAQVGMYVQRMKLMPWYQVLIQETGAAKPGLIDKDSQILRPNAFIVTNIGLNHVKYYGSQEGIMRDKLSIDNYLPADGVAFINYDDPLLKTQTLKHRIISYAIDNHDADYYAESISESDGVITFDIIEKKSGTRSNTKIRAFGKHNVINAVCAFAVGKWLGISNENIVAGLAKFKTRGTRQNLVIKGGNKVFVDCYNASEVAVESAASALDTINPNEDGKRIFVFGDIDDKLGDVTEEVHRRVGSRFVNHKIDSLVCFGEHAAWAAEEAEKTGVKVFHTCDRDEMHKYLKAELGPNDAIAFKGGQQMCLSWTVDYLFATSFGLLDGDVLKTISHYTTIDGIKYRVIKGYGALVYSADAKAGNSFEVLTEVEGEPVVCVRRHAFKGIPKDSVVIPECIRRIEKGIFS